MLYVGHRGHDEATGTLAVAPDAIRLVESDRDLERVLPTVADPTRVALLAQTTLSMHDWEGITDRARAEFPELWTAARNDLCFATTNRQAALQAIAADADAIVVIGSANSSNTIALTKVAAAAGCPVVLRVDGPDELDAEALRDARVVGVTAGASAPEDLVQAVIARLAPTDGVVPVHVTEEDEYFPPPRELREMMATLDHAAAVMLGGTGVEPGGAFTDDRRVDASDVLARAGQSSRVPPRGGSASVGALVSVRVVGSGRGGAARSALEHRRHDRLAHHHRDPADAREHLALWAGCPRCRRCPPG